MPGWNWQKIKQKLSNTPRLNFLTNMSKKQGFLGQGDDMINWNENENDNEKETDHINKT